MIIKLIKPIIIILILITIFLNLSLANCKILSADEINFGDISIIDVNNEYITAITKSDIKIECNNNNKIFFCLETDNNNKITNNYNVIEYELYQDANFNKAIGNSNTSYAGEMIGNNIYNLVIYAKAFIRNNISSGLYLNKLLNNNITFNYKEALLNNDKHPGCINLSHNNKLSFNLPIKANIIAECLIKSVSDLNFGEVTSLNNNIKSSANINIKCTDNYIKYKLNIGTGNYFNNNVRRMYNNKNGYINYYIYRDINYSLIWDFNKFYDFIGNSDIKVFGLVPAQNQIPAGKYQDTLKILINH